MKRAKQVIILRKDLKMRRGKEIAQGAHASLKVILDMIKWSSNKQEGKINVKGPVKEWVCGSFTKICVIVNSEEELIQLYERAKEENLPCAMIVDSGKTEFNSTLTKTCIAIGPCWEEDVDKITGHLKLY